MTQAPPGAERSNVSEEEGTRQNLLKYAYHVWAITLLRMVWINVWLVVAQWWSISGIAWHVAGLTKCSSYSPTLKIHL